MKDSNRKTEQKKEKTKKEKSEKEEKIDEQLDDTFPASDPPSYSQPGNDFEDDKNEENKKD